MFVKNRRFGLNNIIVEESPGTIRGLARAALKGHFAEAVSVAMIFLVLTQGIASLFSDYIRLGAVPRVVSGVTIYTSYISQIYSLIMPGILMFGFVKFFLASFRLKDNRVETVFDGFDQFAKAFSLMIVERVFIMLWTLLFIIPGIVASYRYSLAFYILVDDPDKGVMQCIRESKERMIGNKLRLFLLQLSYMGWLILSSIPVTVMMTLYGIHIGGPYDESKVLMAVIINLVGVIPIAAVYAYMQMGITVFYELQTGHLVPNARAIPGVGDDGSRNDIDGFNP